MPEKDINDLLESIRLESGCMYFSDLHSDFHRPRVREAVLKIEAGLYPARTWRDALRYIAGETDQTADASETRERLLQFLSV